jgi:hypothetical protein
MLESARRRTGLRTPPAEVRDLTPTTCPDGSARGGAACSTRRHAGKAEWITGTPGSRASRRTVPLPPWLAARMADYLANTHGDNGNPTAPLFPRRLSGGARYKGQRAEVRLDWSDLQGSQTTVRFHKCLPAAVTCGYACAQLSGWRPSTSVKPYAPASCAELTDSWFHRALAGSAAIAATPRPTYRGVSDSANPGGAMG